MTVDEDLKEEFAEITKNLPYYPKSIFPSELFLFYKEAKKIGVDHIIESGIGYGGSTTYLDKLFPEVPITSIDTGDVEEVRSRHDRIKFVKGDGRKEVLKAILFSKGDKIAVLIDGPKGLMAVALAQKILGIDRVRLVAVHDLNNRDIEYVNIIKSIDSKDLEFRKFAGNLDRKANLKKYPNGPGLKVYLC